MQLYGTPEQINALFIALIAAQSQFPPIPKTKSAYNYKYAPLPEIHDKIRPVLTKHGLALFHPIDRIDGKQCIGTVVAHTGGGRLSSDGLAIPEVLKIQEQGGVVTYGMRYGTCAILGIAAQDDDDAAMASGKARRASRRDGVAQPGRAPLVAPATGYSGDSGSTPDPSLPTKEERSEYAKKINIYKQFIDLRDLEAYLLSQTGASEARFITKKQWDAITQRLDSTLAAEGPSGLKKLIGGTA